MARPLWHILLIEDSADDRADLRQMLLRGASRRYRFSEAELGTDGVRQVLEGTHGPVDCVLLDYSLPDMDAPELLAALCQGTDLPPCPVVVITGTEGEDGLSLLGAGAQDYIGKRWTSAESLTRAVENAVERFAMMVQRGRTDAALRASEERYRALFDSIDVGYAVMEVIFDDQGVATDARYRQVNRAFSRQSGLGDVEGRTLLSLIPGLEPTQLAPYGSVALTGVPVRFQRHSEELQRWFDVYAFSFGEPNAREVAALFYDITERKKVEVALLAAKAEAERANRAKSDFLLGMSHELRSPLSTMLGFAQLIEAGAPTAAQQDSVQQILHAGWYLLGLINEILDLTAIESGRMAVASQAVSLNDVLDDCRAMIEPQANAAGIELRFPDPGQAWLVQADAIRTKQVLLNLLTNAIKYNRSPGRVDVHCAVAPGRRVRVSVQDSGRGLSAAQLDQIFEPFNRLGQESSGEPGTGIGLVICKRLVELMGGRLGFESTVGVGSCFWFELDRVPVLPVLGLPAFGTPLRTVLCIENDLARLQQIEHVLARSADVCLLRAPDIRAGLATARTARPDAILLGVPLRDPLAAQAMLQLAKDPATAHIPVIALGSDAVPRDIEAGLAAGCFDYLAQPMHGDVLEQVLELAFQRNHKSGMRSTAEEIPPC